MSPEHEVTVCTLLMGIIAVVCLLILRSRIERNILAGRHPLKDK